MSALSPISIDTAIDVLGSDSVSSWASRSSCQDPLDRTSDEFGRGVVDCWGGVSLALAALISIPLYVAYDHLVERSRLEERVPEGRFQVLDQAVYVSHVRATLGDPPLVSVIVSSAERLENAHLDELKQLISEQVGHEIQLEAQLNIRR